MEREASLLDSLAAVEAALQDGDTNALRARLAALDTRSFEGATIHMRVARLAESLGDLDRAVMAYNLALRDEPGHAGVLRRLGQLRSDQGNWVRAARCFEHLAAATPEDPDAWLEWGASLEAGADPRQASDVYTRGFEVTGDPRLAVATRRLRQHGADVARLGDATGGDVGAPGPLTDAAVITFATRFSGREGVYARQWVAPGGKAGYSPVEEPFTPAVARLHLTGALTAGVYPVRSDDTTPFLAFDLDVAKFAASAPDATRAWPRLMRLVHGHARAIMERLADLGIPHLLEDSGQKGRHVWVFFETPVPATAARRLARLVLDALPPAPSEVGVEVFPKQARVGASGFGNLIKLPLGIHRRTGRWSTWLDEEGRPLPAGLTVLASHPCLGRQALLEVLSAHALPEPGAADDDPAPGPSSWAPAAALPAAPIEPDRDEELLWLRRGCAVIDAIARRAEAEHTLTPGERAALTYTVGHLGHGPQLVNHYLGRTYNVEAGELLKTRLSGHPMSCPKVRSRASDLAAAVGCACRFDDCDAPYPTPLLHLRGLRQRGMLVTDPVQLTGLELERLVVELVRLRGDLNRTAHLAEQVETRLREAMRAQDVATVNTPAGVLTLETDGALRLALGRPTSS